MFLRGLARDESALQGHTNLVTWALSGKYNDDKPVIIDAANTSRFVSRRKARHLVAALAGAFEANSTVCLDVPNDILYPVLVLAILASNCRWTGTNPAYTASELEHHFRISETKYVITLPDHLEAVCAAVEASDTNAEIILFSDLLEKEPKSVSDQHERHVRTASCSCVEKEARPWAAANDSANDISDTPKLKMRTLRELLHDPAITDIALLTKPIPLDSAAALLQTSGTTGLPKMAIRTHRAMMNEQHAIEDNNADKPYEVHRLYCTPIFHGYAAPEMIFNVIRLGQTSYFMRRFDSTFAQKVHDLGITETFGAPAMWQLLMSQPNAGELLQSLRLISFAGAPLAPELRRKVLEVFAVKPRVVPVYGMTEGGWYSTLKYPEIDDTGSVGRPIPGYEVKVVPKENTGVMDEQPVGEILVRGPQLMTGYLGNPAATAEAFEGDWLRTGDIGYLKDGKVYHIDRTKDLIKVNGWQVAPAELENALLQHPDVLDAAVMGIGHDVDEHPVACIVVRDSSVTEDSIKAHLRSRLASYKVSKCEVRFMEAIPKSPTGKTMKKALRGLI